MADESTESPVAGRSLVDDVQIAVAKVLEPFRRQQDELLARLDDVLREQRRIAQFLDHRRARTPEDEALDTRMKELIERLEASTRKA